MLRDVAHDVTEARLGGNVEWRAETCIRSTVERLLLSTSVWSIWIFSPSLSGHALTRRWCGRRRSTAALVRFSTRS